METETKRSHNNEDLLQKILAVQSAWIDVLAPSEGRNQIGRGNIQTIFEKMDDALRNLKEVNPALAIQYSEAYLNLNPVWYPKY